jgi:hypothetical protein
VVLTNAWPSGAPEALAAEFMDLVEFGKTERDWYPPYHALMSAFNAPFGSLVGKPRPASPALAVDLAAYVGSYANDFFGPAQIIRRSGDLVLKLGPKGVEYPLRHWDGNAFTFAPSSENATEGSISLATFKAEAKGRFRELTIEYLDGEGLGTFRRK